MFVEEDHIGQRRCVGAGDQVFKHESTAVETDRGREQKADLLRECTEACRRVARGRD